MSVKRWSYLSVKSVYLCSDKVQLNYTAVRFITLTSLKKARNSLYRVCTTALFAAALCHHGIIVTVHPYALYAPSPLVFWRIVEVVLPSPSFFNTRIWALKDINSTALVTLANLISRTSRVSGVSRSGWLGRKLGRTRPGDSRRGSFTSEDSSFSAVSSVVRGGCRQDTKQSAGSDALLTSNLFMCSHSLTYENMDFKI